jgi:hypothetical protein
MSGTFDQLGLHVPGPYLGANESNPKGFFESKWSVRFHKQITSAAGINDFDSRPDAFALAQTAVTDELRADLRDFLTFESRDHDQVVVKDPRSVWTQEVWRDAAEQVGLEIVFISMLRHPAEVVGSRTTYYAKPRRRRCASVVRDLQRRALGEQLAGERARDARSTACLRLLPRPPRGLATGPDRSGRRSRPALRRRCRRW